MSSQELPAFLPKRTKIHFFPSSFPDETLFSRLSRYHLLSAERKDDITFIELFGRPGESVDFTRVAPAYLMTLGSLLPGDPMVQLGNILNENTFVPLVVSTQEEHESHEFGEAWFCPICLVEDEMLFGSPYLKRSHQLPAVTACWKHAAKLLDRCGNCRTPLKRPGKFLRAPFTVCSCGSQVNKHESQSAASKGELLFAKHAHDVLSARTKITSIAPLVRFFLQQVENGSDGTGVAVNMNRKMLVEVIAEQLRVGQSTAEIANSAASVMASARKETWWLGDVM